MTTLLIGTRKGAFFYSSQDRRTWTLAGPHHLGAIVYHVVLDPRDRRTLLLAAKTGHLGPTVFRSQDGGATWQEATRPPAFRTGEPRGRSVDHVFWLTPGHASEPGVWYAGTSPQGIFRSEDGGLTWEGLAGFNEHPEQATWVGGDKDQTPEGGKLHSIQVDPRDPAHLYLGMSSGGVFETTDRGATWRTLNSGMEAEFLPELPEGQEHTFGHDPHCLVQHPTHPDRLWHQNHCGIYVMDRPEGRWRRVGRAMPAEVGDIGFPMTVHPRDPEVAWVFPMDGTSVWPRTSPGGRPAVYGTRDGGKSWQRLDKGMPVPAWWTVKRQAMAADALDPVGLYFGTTSGEIWGSVDEGASWHAIAGQLPHIYSVEACEA
jgi:hypothetical protein